MSTWSMCSGVRSESTHDVCYVAMCIQPYNTRVPDPCTHGPCDPSLRWLMHTLVALVTSLFGFHETSELWCADRIITALSHFQLCSVWGNRACCRR